LDRHNSDSATRELEWIKEFGSGTLRRCVEENFAWKELYLEERTAFEFGYGFRPLLASRTTIGQPIAEGDNKAVTETCWWYERLCYCSISTNPRYPHREGAKHELFVDRDEELIDRSMLLTCKEQGWRKYWPADDGLNCITLYMFCNDYNECDSLFAVCSIKDDIQEEEDEDDY
jgi:hypothetical protein